MQDDFQDPNTEAWEKLPQEKSPPPTKHPLDQKEVKKKHTGVSHGLMYFNIVLALLAGAMIGFFAFWYTLGPKTESLKEVIKPSASPKPTLSPSPQQTVEPAKSDNIIVETPLRGSSVKSPIKVSGSARVFESALSMRLKDLGGKIIAEENIRVEPGEVGQMSAFATFLAYPKQTIGTQGTLEVFTKAASDGREEDLIQIGVVFQ